MSDLNPHNNYSLLELYSELRSNHGLLPIEERYPPNDSLHPVAIEIMQLVNAEKGCEKMTWSHVRGEIMKAEADAEDGW